MAKVYEMDHPLIQHKVTLLRKKSTGAKEFRELAKEISMLMAYEVTKNFPLGQVEVETPIQKTKSYMIKGKKVGIVPILRAGLGMVDGFLDLIPAAKVGHVGLYRDPETLEPVEYYCKMPTDVSERELIVVDPMLATGGSAIAAIQFVKDKGAKNIKFAGIIGCPEGVKALKEAHPDVDIYIASIDEKLNDKAYIIPGLGDAGDRLYGTK